MRSPDRSQVSKLVLEAHLWEKTEIAIPPLSFFHPRKEKDYQVSEPTIGLWVGQRLREEGSADCNAVRAEKTAKRVSGHVCLHPCPCQRVDHCSPCNRFKAM